MKLDQGILCGHVLYILEYSLLTSLAADILHYALTATIGEGSSVLLVGVEYSAMVARFYARAYILYEQ